MNANEKDIILSVTGLSKRFWVNENKADTFKQVVVNTFTRLVRGIPAKSGSEFWALKDVSFELERGQSLGIIGSNGAGKSTLLKILSNITEPTAGQLKIKGRSVSILEIGTGFHPDLTGAENIYLNGELMGISGQEIKNKYFDRIVEFSGVEDFIHTPVKHYSSGMYVRLAFSVAAHINADLLILDEVLSVGDAEFRLKAMNRIKSLIKSGTSILFVTHNLGEVLDLCSNCIWMEDGRIKMTGPSNEIIKLYAENSLLQNFSTGSTEQETGSASITSDTSFSALVSRQIEQSLVIFAKDDEAPGDENLRINHIAVYPVNGEKGDSLFMKHSLVIEINVSLLDAQEQPVFIGFRINDLNGGCAFGSSCMVNENLNGIIQKEGKYLLTAQIPGNFFNAGIFSISIAYSIGFNPLTIIPGEILYFKILFNEEERNKPWFENFPGVARPDVTWNILLQ